ncbi:MAG: hypothetical protein MI862_09060 [Desulfobacterales bacterium]|nr:hypothetical protein [Desulfobacterales bacterium]
MDRSEKIIFIFTLAVLLFTPLPCGAGETAPRGPLGGIWDISDQGNDKYSRLSLAISYQFVGLGHRTADTPVYGVGVVQWPGTDYWSEATAELSVEKDGTVIMNFGKFAYCNCVPVVYRMKPTDDPDILVGEWRYDKKNQKGSSRWQRKPEPRLDKLGYYTEGNGKQQVTGVTPGHEALAVPQNMTRGDLRLYIWGDRLAGGHNVWMDPEGGNIRVREAGWVCGDGSRRRWGDGWRKCGSRETLGDGVAGIYLDIRFKAPLDAGTRTLWLDGQAMKLHIFDPSQPGSGPPPAPRTAAVQSVEILNAASLEPAVDVKPGDRIRVRVTFDSAPAEPAADVSVKTHLSGDEIIVTTRPTKDPAVFLSEPVRVKGVSFGHE